MSQASGEQEPQATASTEPGLTPFLWPQVYLTVRPGTPSSGCTSLAQGLGTQQHRNKELRRVFLRTALQLAPSFDLLVGPYLGPTALISVAPADV